MRKRKPSTNPPPRPLVPPQLLNILEVAAILNVGRTKVYSLIKKDGLPVVKVGSEMRISVTSLHKWIEERERVS